LTNSIDFTVLFMTENLEKTPKKRNHKRNAIIALIGLAIFVSHVFLTKGSSEFIVKLLHGDVVYISNVVMTSMVLGGWLLIYKHLGKLL